MRKQKDHAKYKVLKNPLENISNIRSIVLMVRGGKVWTYEELKYDHED